MKEKYLQTICNKLNERGFVEYNSEDLLSTDRKPFSTEKGEVLALSYLPEENLKMIAENDTIYKAVNSYYDWYQACGREGYFKFKPYIVNKADSPTLCLRHNRFLHMFRGYHFQISGTYNGIGECSSGLMRTDGFMNLLRYNKPYCKSHLGFIVMYAAMIDCAFHNDNFRDWFYSNGDEVDEYFRSSMRSWNVDFDYGFDVVRKYVSYRDGNLISSDCGHTVYYIEDKYGVMCRFWESPDKVEVEYCCDREKGIGRSKIVTFDIPSPEIGMDSMYIEDEELNEELNDEFEGACYTREKIEYFILLMLLKFVGVNTNFIASYAVRKIGSIRPITDEGAKCIEKFDQIEF